MMNGRRNRVRTCLRRVCALSALLSVVVSAPAWAQMRISGVERVTVGAVQDARTAVVQYKDRNGANLGGTVTYTSADVNVTAMPSTTAPTGQYQMGWTIGGVVYSLGKVTESMLTTLSAVYSGTPLPATAVFAYTPGTSYKITVATAAHGKVVAARDSATKGETVTLTTVPDAGYAPGVLTVTDARGAAVTVSSNGTFVMPASAVTVKAVFERSAFPYTDVSGASWYYKNVYYMWKNGLMDGVGLTTFGPETTVTRAMAVTVLWRMEGKPGAVSAGYPDLKADWYRTAANWASASKIAGGYANGRFAPDDPLTREQMAIMLYRYAVYKGIGVSASTALTYSDAGQISAWAVTEVRWAVAKGLMDGMGSVFMPKGTASRAQLATVLMRFSEVTGR